MLTVLLHVGNVEMDTLRENQVWAREEIQGSIIMKFSGWRHLAKDDQEQVGYQSVDFRGEVGARDNFVIFSCKWYFKPEG